MISTKNYYSLMSTFSIALIFSISLVNAFTTVPSPVLYLQKHLNHNRIHNSGVLLHMAGFGGASGSTAKKKNKNNKKKKSPSSSNSSSSSSGAKYDVTAALLRSEKLYDKLQGENTKAIYSTTGKDDDNLEEYLDQFTYKPPNNNDDDANDIKEETIFSEFVVAAKYNPKKKNNNNKNNKNNKIVGSSSVLDWLPIGQICLSRPYNSNDERIPNDLIDAVSLNCRELSHMASITVPIFSKLPRQDIQYSVETMESWYKYVYDNIMENNQDSSSSSSDSSSSKWSKKDARVALGLPEDCNDLKEIKAAYRKLSFKYHPDRFVTIVNQDEETEETEKERKEANIKYTQIKQAYEFLMMSGGMMDSSSSDTSSSSTGLSWYESLGGRERTDFKGPLKLISIQEASERKEKGNWESAVVGIDPSVAMNFNARNQANSMMMNKK